MNKSTKEYIESRINLLEEDNIVEFLYDAHYSLSNRNIDILCNDLEDAGIAIEPHVMETYKKLLRNYSDLKGNQPVYFFDLMRHYPKFGLDEYDYQQTLKDAIQQVYPDKKIKRDSLGRHVVE